MFVTRSKKRHKRMDRTGREWRGNEGEVCSFGYRTIPESLPLSPILCRGVGKGQHQSNNCQ